MSEDEPARAKNAVLQQLPCYRGVFADPRPLLTERNHHRVGFGSVCEFPGRSTVRPESCAPYAFTGTLHEVTFDLQTVPPEAERALHGHASAQAVGCGAAG